MTAPKDYYQVLGISPGADLRAIKQAYRRLARQFHPDLSPNDAAAEERFKEINEAYQVLSSAERRKRYDDRRRSDDRRGRDLELAVEITLEEAFRGITRTVQLEDGRWIEARIPPGVRSRARVRLRGLGVPSIGRGETGDLFLVVQVRPHPRYRRSGDDLAVEVPIDIYTAAVGGEIMVETLGVPVLLRIPPRTQSATVFRLAGMGMPRTEQPDYFGDLYARVVLVLPEFLSDEELNTLRDLREAHLSSLPD